eukprot:302796_1
MPGDTMDNDLKTYSHIARPEAKQKLIEEKEKEENILIKLEYLTANSQLIWCDPKKSCGFKRMSDYTLQANTSAWSTMITNAIISANNYDTFSWTYTVDKFDTELFIGWINNDDNLSEFMQKNMKFGGHIAQSKKYPPEPIENQNGIYIFDNNYVGMFFLYGGGLSERIQFATSKEYKSFKDGDTFEIKIDFLKQKCTVLYNNWVIGEAFQDKIGKEIVPAISLRGRVSQVTISTS